MAEVGEKVPSGNKLQDKHNTDRPPSSGPGGLESPGLAQPPQIRPLNRVDSRSTFPPQVPRPGVPPQGQPRPQFQPGGPVTAVPQLVPRPGLPVARAPVPPGPPGTPQARPPPLRPFGPQSIAPQQGPRPQSPILAAQAPQRAPPPNNLQFGPRQPPVAPVTTPDGARPQIPLQSNGYPKNGPAPAPGQLPRQSSQSSLKGDSSNSYQNKPGNLDNQTDIKNDPNIFKAENGMEMAGMAKGRSYSIAAAPGAPSPLKMEDDRRKSVSAIGGKIDEFVTRSPGLGLIQEGKLESKENVRGSKESVRSEASNEGGREIPDRPESRISAGSKMTESFMGSLSNLTPKKKMDDDDVVVPKNNTGMKNLNEPPKTQGKTDLYDRSPSLTRSDDSPELKHTSQSSIAPLKSQTATPEPPRPKTPKSEIQQIATPNKTPAKSPIQDLRSPMTPRKPNELDTTIPSTDSKKVTPRKTASAPKARPKDGDNDSGVDESTQGNDMNGSPGSPNKKIPSKLPTKEKSSSSLKPNLSRSSSKSATPKTPENPPCEKKKVPMNKVQVGNAPSPNIKAVKSKIGSLENATYKPGGGKVKIENRKLEFGNVTPKIAAKNDAYTPSGGTKKITTTKLEWNVRSKVGSLQNAAYKPGGGDKKIETVKLDFKEKAKPKVASTVNITHKPGGGGVKIENQKLEFKGHSKVGSMDNVKHKPGGGDIKIFDDKDYIKQMTGHSPQPDSHGHSRQEEDHYYMSTREWSEEDRPKSRCLSARAPRTPRALSPRRRHYGDDREDEIVRRNNELNRRKSMARPATARDPPSSVCSRRASLTQRPAFSIY